MLRFRTRKKTEILSLEEAVKKYMHDGACIAHGGFTSFARKPAAFVWETIRQGFKDFHVVEKGGGYTTFMLRATKRIKIEESCWFGWGEMVGKLDVNFEKQFKSKEITTAEYSHGGMSMRLLAGAMGIPFIPYYGVMGSDIYNPECDQFEKEELRDGKNPRIARKKFLQMEDPFYGEGTLYLLPALRPEIAIIHVPKAGDKGTARWEGVSSTDKELIFACDKLILTCEEIVSEEKMRENPTQNQIPSFAVDAIVECRWGAHPTGVPFYYDYDAKFMQDINKASMTEEGMKAWLDEWVFGPKNWGEYLKKLGVERLEGLRVSSTTGYSNKLMRGRVAPPNITEPLSVIKSGF